MQIWEGEIVSGAKYQMDEQFQSLIIFRILIVFILLVFILLVILLLVKSFPNLKKSENFLIFKVGKFGEFLNFIIWKIPNNL